MNSNISREPTLDEIKELTAFLPILYRPGFSPVETWEGGKQVDGTITLPYPKYAPEVEEFYRTASQEQWFDTNYSPENAYKKIKNPIEIQSASLSEVKSMLTFCIRGERFSDGHWGEMIEKGIVRALLERLIKIGSERNEKS